MYVYISIDKMFHVEHFSILQATFTDIFRGRGRPRRKIRSAGHNTSGLLENAGIVEGHGFSRAVSAPDQVHGAPKRRALPWWNHSN